MGNGCNSHGNQKLVIIGVGGHARSVADSVDPEVFDLIGYVDEYRTDGISGKPVFGSRIVDVPDYKDCAYLVGIGDCHVRKRWFETITRMGLKTVNVIDKTAQVSPSVKMGTGNFVGKFAVINAGTIIGDNNLVNTMALLEHESRVWNHTNLSTRSTINGDVVVEDCVFLGSGATCIGQLTLGRHSVIGAGSVVIRDVDPGCTVVGIPAKVIKHREEYGV